jgi:PAS domain S-box-containing protein
MQAVSPTPDESRRLAVLYAHQILDTPNEDAFDAFVRVAAAVCGVPVSLISLIDLDRVWFKANLGLENVTEISREDAFCALTIQGDAIFEIRDTHADPRFADNVHVTGDPHIRFYAAAPLITAEGDAVGTICVIDHKPRRLTEQQRTALGALRDAVVDQLAARRALLRLFDSAETEFYHLDFTAGHVTFASEAARQNLGYTQRELAGLSLAALLPAFDEAQIARCVAALRASTEHRTTMRTVMKRRDGSTYPAELRMELVSSRNREVAFATATNLTDAASAREKIELLSAAIECVDDAVVISKPGRTSEEPPTIVYANAAFLRIKRATAANQVIGVSVATFTGPETDPEVSKKMRDHMLRGEPGGGANTLYRADGTTYRALVAGRPLLDESGKTTHFVVIEHDVTDVVLRDEQLEMQNERLTALTAIARGLFASLEPQALVEALLAGARELAGADARLLVASPNGGFAVTHDLAVPEGTPATGDPFIEAASRSDVTSIADGEKRAAIRIPGSLGQTRYMLDVRCKKPLHTADIFALGLLGQYFAVAARNVELYHELQTRRAAVVELNQVKNDLIAMLAHDFKGPLTTIVGFADVLAEDDRFDDEARKFLNMISSSAMRLASLATDTLALSRLEQNELALTIEEFDLVGLVREIVRVFSVTRQIELRTDRPELVVAGDPARLRQVFENLIGNAIKYSPSGESVEVFLRAKGRGVEISVRDHGIGIPDADKPKLFGRFARAQNARAMGIGGTGFGLYLSKTIVEMHGGTIGVDSQESMGSTFRVFLPSSIAAQRPKHRRFILVDADGDARSYVAHTLRDDGSAATVVANGKDLLDAVDEKKFDAALVDVDRIGMPLEEFVRRVAGRTALIRIDTKAAPETEGWDGQLVKPFLVKDLQAVIEGALLRQPQRQPAFPATTPA